MLLIYYKYYVFNGAIGKIIIMAYTFTKGVTLNYRYVNYKNANYFIKIF